MQPLASVCDVEDGVLRGWRADVRSAGPKPPVDGRGARRCASADVGKGCVASGRGGEIPDFEVKVKWDGRPMATLEFAQMDIRFVRKGTGLYFADKTSGSAFTGVYKADTNNIFQTEFTCSATRNNGVFSDSGVPKGKLMVVRSRCKLDDKGNILEANYSTIRTLFIEGAGTARLWQFSIIDSTPHSQRHEP